jgi:uncharacterized protein (TIGR00255 family)
MARIHKLPVSVVNRIAAGEVVERPASAVKELLENAFDASPSRVDVALEQGGIALVRVVDDGGGIEADEVWPLVNEATLIAIDNIDQMRAAEGATMAAVLRDELRSIAGHRDLIAGLAPNVVQQYRDRIESRVQRFIEGRGIEVTQLDLLREVQLFADRADISEELTRLASHLTMFEETMTNTEAAGRKLDFIIQEMFRETNTIGSKAGDARIAASVVEIKCSIERMRELVQNIE